MGRANRQSLAVADAGPRRGAALSPEGVVWCTSTDHDIYGEQEQLGARAPAPSELRYQKGSVLLIGGLYGLGKTTLAERLCPEATIIDPDAVRAELDLVWGEGDGYKKVFKEMWARVDAALEAGENVVCTAPGLYASQRRNLGGRAKVAGVDFNIIYLDGDVELSAAGQAGRERDPIPAERVQEMSDEWQYMRWRLATALADGDDYAVKTKTRGAKSVLVCDRETVDGLKAIRFED